MSVYTDTMLAELPAPLPGAGAQAAIDSRSLRTLAVSGVNFSGEIKRIIGKTKTAVTPERIRCSFMNVYVQVHCSRVSAVLQCLNGKGWEVYNPFLPIGF